MITVKLFSFAAVLGAGAFFGYYSMRVLLDFAEGVVDGFFAALRKRSDRGGSSA